MGPVRLTRADKAARYNPGPPSSPRILTNYGHFPHGKAAKQFRINRLHGEALLENAQWTPK